MKPDLEQVLDNLHSKNKEAQDAAFTTLVQTTKETVDWAYEIWDDYADLWKQT